MKTLISLCAVAALAACTVYTPPSASAPQATSAANGTVTGFTAQINSFRAAQGLGQLRPSAALDRAAQAHADDMARRGYFSHVSRGGPNGSTFVQRARSGGCAMGAGAENIATGQRNEAAAFAAWRDSAGHRRNMLGRDYRLYGLGRSGDIWVLKLASRC